MKSVVTPSEFDEMWRARELACVLAAIFGGPLDERGHDLIHTIEGLL